MKIYLLAISFVLPCLNHLAAQTIYNGPANGDWGDANNWSAGVPDQNVNAVIDNDVTTGASATRNTNNLTVNAGHTVTIDNNANLIVNGSALTVEGELQVVSLGSGTDLVINHPNAVFSGQGAISLSSNQNSRILGGGILTNTSTIQGRGKIGVNQLTITNANDGLIHANLPVGTGVSLEIDPSTGGLVNEGVLRASNGGLMILLAADYTNTEGVIEALGAGSRVLLREGFNVIGGTLQTSDGAQIIASASTNTFFTDVAFPNGTEIVSENNSDFGVTGTINNNGTITLFSQGSGTDIELQSNASFTGTGDVVLANNPNARINGSGILTNTSEHTIRGQGNIGVNAIGIINNGTIRADIGGAELRIDPNTAGFDNNKVLEAVNGATLLLVAGNYANENGQVNASGAGSSVVLTEGARLTGGILQTSDGGQIIASASTNTFYTDVTFPNGTEVLSQNNTDFGVTGTINNNGTITIFSEGSGTDIELQSNTSFTGTGEVVLANNPNAQINGSGILTNTSEHTIRGQGNIGVNAIGIINNGLIRADVEGQALTIDPNAEGLDNNNVLEAVSGGTLVFSAGDYDNQDGIIRVSGANSRLVLLEGARIHGGMIITTDGGLVIANASTNTFFTDVSFPNGTEVLSQNNTDFGVSGTITNDGAITMFSEGSGTDIELQADTSFTGTGEVVLANHPNARINGAGTLTNSSEHTIRGQGNIGVNAIGIINNGTIRADIADRALSLDPSAAGFENNNLLEATNGASLTLLPGEYDNRDGRIEIAGENSVMLLTEGARIQGGTLRTTNGGQIIANASTNTFYADITFAEGTQVLSQNNTDFGVVGTITNHGTLTMFSEGSATDIELQESTVFTGNGEIVLSNRPNARINGLGTFSNGPGHTIRGQGNIGVNDLLIFNAEGATISADVAGTTLTLDPLNGTNGFRNRGLIKATNGGILLLTSGSFNNVGGTVLVENDSQVTLSGGATLSGGTISSEGSGFLEIASNQSVNLSDVALDSNVVIQNNATLTTSGTFNNRGSVEVNSLGSNTQLAANGILNLTGGGQVELNGPNARLSGNGVFINQDQLITGSGNIGANQAAVTNASGGVIHANQDGGTLTLDPNTVLGLTSDGILRASNGGTLTLSGNGGGEFSIGDSGVVEALDGGFVTQVSNALLTNLQNGVLTGGTYRAIDQGNGAALDLPGGAINTNAATIELSGESAEFSNLTNLTENVGRLSLLNGATLNSEGGFTQSPEGTLEIGIEGKPSETGLWGKLVEAGAATLNGTLDVLFNVGQTFTAAVGDKWKVLTSAIVTGEFANVNFTSEGLPANSELSVNYLTDGVEVEVVATAGLKAAGTTYEAWAALLPSGMDSDPEADPDKDGVSNLQEYAFAMDPMASDADLLPRLQIVRHDDQHFLAITYERPSGLFARTDISYTLVTSEDLQTWVADGGSTAEVVEADQENIERVTARCLKPIGQTSAYARLAVKR